VRDCVVNMHSAENNTYNDSKDQTFFCNHTQHKSFSPPSKRISAAEIYSRKPIDSELLAVTDPIGRRAYSPRRSWTRGTVDRTQPAYIPTHAQANGIASLAVAVQKSGRIRGGSAAANNNLRASPTRARVPVTVEATEIRSGPSIAVSPRPYVVAGGHSSPKFRRRRRPSRPGARASGGERLPPPAPRHFLAPLLPAT
jgi:hypothetical protein